MWVPFFKIHPGSNSTGSLTVRHRETVKEKPWYMETNSGQVYSALGPTRNRHTHAPIAVAQEVDRGSWTCPFTR